MDSVSATQKIDSNIWESDYNIGLMGRFYTATGKIDEKNFGAKYKGLILSVKKTDGFAICNFRGSLSKFFTNGQTNAIDFTRLDLIQAIEKLERELHINPNKTEIKSFEFCVIVESPFDMNYLKNSLLTHKQLNYSLETENGKAFGFIFKRQQYHFKIYFKDMQESKIWNNRLKIEVSVKKMIFVDGYGIKYLSDLKKESVWQKLSELLIKLWKEIIFVEKDKYNKEKMRTFENSKLQKFLNSNYWSDKNLDDNNFYKAKFSLEKLNQKYLTGESGKQIIAKLIREKCDFLIKSGEELTTLENSRNYKNGRGINHLDNKVITLPNPIEKEQKKLEPKNAKKCKNGLCQNDITNRRKNALFCCTKCRCKHHREQERILQKLLAFCP